jgi:subtilase family serine protease
LTARRLTAGLVGLGTTAGLLAAAGTAQAVTATARIQAAAPVPAGAVRLGALPGATKLRIDVTLQPRDPAALSRFVSEVSKPGSALYRHYLTRGQFAARFGATRAEIAAVRAALIGRGLHPGAVSANHLFIPVTATTSAIEQAFATHIGRYRLPGGKLAFANSRAVRLPASAAPFVQGVIGLDNLDLAKPLLARPARAVAKQRTGALARPAGEPTGGPQPCTQATNAAAPDVQNFFGLTADQLAFAYDFSPLYGDGDFGQGVNVGIVEFGEPNLPTDIAKFQGCYHTHDKVSYLGIDGYHKTGSGEGEAALDIETVISLAPLASITVFRGPNTQVGGFDTYATAIIQDRIRVLSVSYGLCEKYQAKKEANSETTLFEQAAAQGQTILASSGDSGSEACLPFDGNKNTLAVNFPASDPLVTSVGGTSVVVSSGLTNPPAQVVWNDGYDGDGAGGGGKSTFYKMPSWQASFLKVPAKSNVREVPDVSADADPESGYVIVYKGKYQVIGGTSAAAPLWAALIALTDAPCSSPVGFANPLLYLVAGPADPHVVITDITQETGFNNNRNNNYTHFASATAQFTVKNGYDMATGLGSPVGGTLAPDLCSFGTQSQGYRMVSKNGTVYSFNAPSDGSVAAPGSPVVGIADDPDGNGYWVVTARGKVFAFGGAPNLGSAKVPTGASVVGITDNPKANGEHGDGYWLVTNKGHVYSFGADTKSHGSVTTKLASPVVGIAADPFKGGYWIVTAQGHVYSFGASKFKSVKINSVTGVATSLTKEGFWAVTATGAVWGFSVNPIADNPVGNAGGKVIGITPVNVESGGLWLATAAGHVAAIGAQWHGDHPGQSKTNPIVGIAGTV